MAGPRHPFRRSPHPTYWKLFPVAALVICLVSAGPAAVSAPDDDKRKSKKDGVRNDFLLIGTVFTEEGFLLRGTEIRVRRVGEPKVRWRGVSDRRGEFAVRVPGGAEYEMTVAAKGFQEQARKVDARTGSREDLVFRLAPAPKGKKK